MYSINVVKDKVESTYAEIMKEKDNADQTNEWKKGSCKKLINQEIKEAIRQNPRLLRVIVDFHKSVLTMNKPETNEWNRTVRGREVYWK